MKIKEILIQITFLFLLLILLIITKNEVIITIGIILMLLLSFKIKYYKNEWKLLLFGIIIGLLFEILGDLVFKLQYWEQGALLGIPIWLPIMWGYGFIFIRRIGNLIVK